MFYITFKNKFVSDEIFATEGGGGGRGGDGRGGEREREGTLLQQHDILLSRNEKIETEIFALLRR